MKRPEINGWKMTFPETFYYRVLDEEWKSSPFIDITVQTNRKLTKEEYDTQHNNEVSIIVAIELEVSPTLVLPITKEEFMEHVDTSMKPAVTKTGNAQDLKRELDNPLGEFRRVVESSEVYQELLRRAQNGEYDE